jgi:cytochrome P450
MRAETAEALPLHLLNTWKKQLLEHADALLSAISLDQPFDLMAAYARLLCFPFAVIVSGLPQQDSLGLCEKARTVSDAAAAPYNQALKQSAKTANDDIRRHFHSGPEILRDSGFVGLSQTLPAMLGNIWFALLQNPREWQRLHRRPERIDQAIEELVRYAGFTRVLSRHSIADLTVGGISIPKDNRVILRLTPANRDPECFENPHQINLARRGATHLSFGLGPHSCVGAGLLRMAISAVTLPLVSRFSSPHLIGPVDWLGGATFSYPAALWVDLHRELRPSRTPEATPAAASPPAEPPQSPAAPPATVPLASQTVKARSPAASAPSLHQG